MRSQLERILASDIFARSERLSAFLRFAVEETLAGRGDSLKEQVLAVEIYGRKPGSTNDDDSIVRADARRLRDKLREFYASAGHEPVIISLPKGGYTPLFERNAAAPVPALAPFPPRPETTPAPRNRPQKAVWAAGVAAFVILGTLLAWQISRKSPPPLQLVHLTAYPGQENNPSLSPDGNFVAFAWSGSEKPGPPDIWIKAVDGEALHRLTQTAAGENNPAWSPDGKEIAFNRHHQGRQQGVFIVSHIGGPERKVSDSGTSPKWTPDSRSLLIRDRLDDRRPTGIFQLNLDTLERRQITQPASGEGDWRFEVSPDGATLAFSRSDRPGVADIYTVPKAGGEPRRLTDWGAPMYGLTWTPNSRDIIFAVAGQPLLRIPARGTHPGKGKPLAVFGALVTPLGLPFNPTMSRPAPGQAARLVFETRIRDISLRFIDLEASRSGGVLQVRPLLDATRVDVPGAISPDGERFAFRSYFGGWRLWVAKRDGEDLRQLTPVGAHMVEMGSWSPDGRRIVFDAAVDGNSDLYMVSESGGLPKRLTTEPSTELRPRWSHDGRWIYYSSNRTGRYEIWKTPSSGGPPIQITRHGGFEPFESVDGQSIYYLEQPPVDGVISIGTAKLKIVPASGGDEKVILDVVRANAWGVTRRGIMFLSGEKDVDAIKLYSNGNVGSVGRLPFRVSREGFGRVAFSPDGRWALTNQDDRSESDLMLVENVH